MEGLNGYDAEHATIVSKKNHKKQGDEGKVWEKMKEVEVQRRFTYVITIICRRKEIFSRSLQIHSNVFGRVYALMVYKVTFASHNILSCSVFLSLAPPYSQDNWLMVDWAGS